MSVVKFKRQPMSEFKLVMPKMGESVQEATIIKWFVKEGDQIKEDDQLLEIATDKVDSEIPSPVDGVIKQLLFNDGQLVAVGQTIALITTEAEDEPANLPEELTTEVGNKKAEPTNSVTRFYSPLVKSIAKKEGVSKAELEKIAGSGINGRVKKEDILQFISNRSQPVADTSSIPVRANDEDRVIEADRVRQLIAKRMVDSKRISAHVTTVVEADVTKMVIWHQKNKADFEQKYGERLTYMPLFIEASVAALNDFPVVNSSFNGDTIVLKKHKNIGFALARNDDSLVVPVLKSAEQRNLLGITTDFNRLVKGARANKLSPDQYEGGTFTITNFGSFDNIIGTPIINQPEVAILATGSIQKKPAVIETDMGDQIAIRHKMYLSLSYDHRIIDGAKGGAFLKRIANLLEDFDSNRTI